VQSLIPNTETIEAHLKSFAELVSAEEVVLFERTTFLVVSHVSQPFQGEILDPQRFEKVSSIIKSFKLSCGCTSPLKLTSDGRKLNSEFMSFELRTGAFSAFIDRLTPTTQIMIVIADPTIGIFPFDGLWILIVIESAATLMNLSVARKHFEKLEKWEPLESTEKSKRNGIGVKGKAIAGIDQYPRSTTTTANNYG
jgi:Ras-related GTP-binding protein A/B